MLLSCPLAKLQWKGLQRTIGFISNSPYVTDSHLLHVYVMAGIPGVVIGLGLVLARRPLARALFKAYQEQQAVSRPPRTVLRWTVPTTNSLLEGSDEHALAQLILGFGLVFTAFAVVFMATAVHSYRRENDPTTMQQAQTAFDAALATPSPPGHDFTTAVAGALRQLRGWEHVEVRDVRFEAHTTEPLCTRFIDHWTADCQGRGRQVREWLGVTRWQARRENGGWQEQSCSMSVIATANGRWQIDGSRCEPQ